MFISETPQFEIHRLYAHNSLRNYTYFIFKKATRDITIIDPWDAEDCRNYLKQLNVAQVYVINTHLHHDHTRGNEGLRALGAKFSLPDDFDEISLPGHTEEHVVFLLRDESQHLFCGDTLFQAGVGNCKNGGNPHILFESVQWLKEHLSPEVFVHVGHDYLKKNLQFLLTIEPDHQGALNLTKELEATEGFEWPAFTWKEDLKLNPFLRLSETSVRQGLNRLDRNDNHSLMSDKDIFLILRSKRDDF